MTPKKAGFIEYLTEEINKYKGVYVPIRSGLLRRMLVRHLPCSKIHPNPDDEFCKPEIGPNFNIISKYQAETRMDDFLKKDIFNERLIVERIRPDGYMLLNGHHRWAAAILSGVPKVPVQIVNSTHEMDIKRMLWNSKHDKRASLDLDEVVFSDGGNESTEKGLPFPFSLFYKQRLRLGVPALFRSLNVYGYDVWVYSEKYYSLDYIRTLFRLYHVNVTGIVTGFGRKQTGTANARTKIESMLANRYGVTLSIDRESMLRVNNRTRDFEEFSLSGSAANWSSEITEILRRFEKNEQTD